MPELQALSGLLRLPLLVGGEGNRNRFSYAVTDGKACRNVPSGTHENPFEP
jgi:hypothetical protein